jgi:peroxiredoxin Q/BCP
MPDIGDPAPAFRLPSTSGAPLALADLRGKKVVLYFYPRDQTPGCTREACDFEAAHAKLRAAGALVLGVSKDSLDSHARFRSAQRLGFDLLSDPELAVHKAYGAYGSKLHYGKRIEGVIRSTFLIDEQGKIAARWSPVRVDGHVEKVLAAIHEAGAAKAGTAPRTRVTTGTAAKSTVKAAPAKAAAKPKSAVKAASAAKSKAAAGSNSAVKAKSATRSKRAAR